ncbi:DNA polymerase III, delta subunit [Caldithrix abyssi DSM 13497]|uniref:DNA polymerase III subunit delta n=1 Tax=Caldithrix abyssi DSM 13497 TaxID=880073 RepID=H1XTI6_CALAY|nr:DNA polymerase III subunit delta [Caldithrix abyssi]APF16938.1 DNA polymerase III, delta subunit [Caldithrix abyssi DSM 13497]EHO40419.1 DNA polymerase III, delta subunit [Caldithrix abyssi DSM 13497]
MKTPVQVLKEIDENRIDSVYFLVGGEKFFHDQVINALSRKLFTDRGSRDLNEITLYGTENTQSEVLSQFSAYPMLADKKLVIVREFNKMKIEDDATFKKYLTKPPKFSVLVLCASEAPRNKFFKSLAEAATVVDCKPIRENQLPEWVKQYCHTLGRGIEDQAIHFLVANVGNDILTLKNEIEKVISFKTDEGPITVDDLHETSGVYREANIFALQKALAQRQLGKSLNITHQLMEAGIDPTMINAVLFAFFRKSLMAASLRRQGLNIRQVAQKMKMADFQMRDINVVLQKYNFDQIKKAIKLLNDFDLAQKGIKSSSLQHLELLCYQICRL